MPADRCCVAAQQRTRQASHALSEPIRQRGAGKRRQQRCGIVNACRRQGFCGADNQSNQMVGAMAERGMVERSVRFADLDWHAHLDVGRYDQQFDRRLLEQVFAVPASRALPATGVLAQDDGVAVYQVKGIQPGSLDAVPVERRQELRRTLVGVRASQEFSAYQALLLSAADVEIAEGAAEAAP